MFGISQFRSTIWEMRYDVVLVLGSGIKEDGSIPESAKIRTQKAVEAVKGGEAGRIIFSGRWTYHLSFTPPMTEAEAMAKYAKSLGLDESKIILEKNSVSTVSNFCEVKQILNQYGWTKALLIMNRPYAERAMLNMRKVFGSKYKCDVALTDFRFPPEKEAELEKLEEQKYKVAARFLGQFADGDDEAIYQAATKELEESYIN